MGIGFALTHDAAGRDRRACLFRGVGIWGIDVPVMWGFAIVNFVWWIGIGHAGTLISAILLLLKQDWRTSINRFAEAMTLFAVACAGLFPLLAPGAALGLLLADAVSQHDGPVAAVAQPAGLGRLRGLDLRDGLAPVLVRRADPRPGDPARPGEEPLGPVHLRHSWRWAGAARRGTGTATGRPTCCWPGWRRPLVVSVHTVVALDFTVGDRPRLALDDLPPLLRRRGDLLGLRDGRDARRPAPGGLRPRKTSSRSATSRTWPRSCWPPA